MEEVARWVGVDADGRNPSEGVIPLSPSVLTGRQGFEKTPLVIVTINANIRLYTTRERLLLLNITGCIGQYGGRPR